TVFIPFSRHDDHLDLHSFPTRRSSDLTFRRCNRLSMTTAITAATMPNSFCSVDCESTCAVTPPIRLPATVATSSSMPRRRLINRSEEHTSELQSLAYLVCRLLLEKKNK